MFETYKYYGLGLETNLEGYISYTIVSLGEFEFDEDAWEVADEKNIQRVWCEDELKAFGENIDNVIKSHNLEGGTHYYFGESEEDGSWHLIGTMECISEADEATDAMEAEIRQIVSSERLVELSNKVNDALTA